MNRFSFFCDQWLFEHYTHWHCQNNTLVAQRSATLSCIKRYINTKPFTIYHLPLLLALDKKEQPVSTIFHSAGKSPFTTQHETNQIMNMKDLQNSKVFPLPWAQRTSRQLRKVIADEFIVVAVDRFWLSLQYLSSVFTPDDTQHRSISVFYTQRGNPLLLLCNTFTLHHHFHFLCSFPFLLLILFPRIRESFSLEKVCFREPL